MPDHRLQQSPLAPLVAFSAATNLGLAGRAVRVRDDVPQAPRVRALLRGFGARLVEQGEQLLVAGDAAAAPEGALVVTPGGVQDAPDAAAAARIDWARAHMPVSRRAAAALGDLAGTRVAVSLVLEPKTAVLALLLAEAGAEVSVFAFAAETDDAVVAELARRGIAVHAASTATPADERAHALALLAGRPHLLVDDGAHVIRLAHAERPDAVDGLIGATEETTSGVTPLVAMAVDGALRVPVVAANDAVTKTWFDNRHGTGETCVLAIARVLDHDLEGLAAVVLGFGPVGEGVAQRLAALGARVVVVERDPRRALAARFAGHATAEAREAVADADLVVSATGAPGTVDAAVLAACAPDAVVAVAGGAPEEVLPPAGTRRERIAPHVERLHLPGGAAVRLLAGGDCVNIVAAEGNPIDVMDLSFAVQLTAIRALLAGAVPLAPGVHRVDPADDAAVAAAALGSAPLRRLAPPPAPNWRRTRFDLEA